MEATLTRAPIACTDCGTGPLAYLSPGEAVRLVGRTRVLCGVCATKPPGLTERESEMIEVSRRLRAAEGQTPTYGEIGEVMGLSASRLASIAQRLREKGYGDRLKDARYGTSLENVEWDTVPVSEWADATPEPVDPEPVPVDYFDLKSEVPLEV